MVFYKNGVKQTGPEQVITADRVQLFLSLNGESEITLNTNLDYPEDIKSLFVTSSVPALSFNELLKETEPSESFLSASAGDISAFVLQKLLDLITPVDYLFSSKTFHFTSTKPVLGLELSRKTVESLYKLETQLIDLYNAKSFETITESALLSALTSIEKLIKYHLLLSEDLDDKSLDYSLKKNILDLTVNIIQQFPQGSQTEEAALIISSCFEVFYKEPFEKLTYILESLQRSANNQEVLPIFKQMESQIYQEMARPDKVFPALEISGDNSVETIKKFYSLLLEICTENSKLVISGENPNNSVIKLLETTQAAMLAQAAKYLFKDNWNLIIIDYSKSFLNACILVIEHLSQLYTNGEVPEKVLENVENTIISRILDELLSALVLSPLELSLISEILPLVTKISNELSKIAAVPSALSLGIGIVEEIYESPHNYLDNSQLKQIIRVPNAVKYTLIFDPQCKTENGCDYLELWLDEAGTNKFGRYEGENFPKEPVEVVNPFLNFTFRSDGSVNYWGWKITIKASVECSFYQKQWPDTSKDTAELFFGFCASKLVSGKFITADTSDDLKKILQNPLIKYGVSDKCSLLSRPLKPINNDLQKIVDASLISEKPSESFEFGIDYETGLSSYLETYKSLKTPQYSDSGFLLELFEGSERVVKS